MLHYVASQAEKSNQELLTLPDDLSVLDEASKTSVEQLSVEVTQLDNQIKKIQNQMNAPNTQADVKNQMSEFLSEASTEVTAMKERMDLLKKTQAELADFFCEDPNAFKMEECYKSLASFCSKFKAAVGENVKRREQEALAEQRRAQRELDDQKKAKGRMKRRRQIQNTSKLLNGAKLYYQHRHTKLIRMRKKPSRRSVLGSLYYGRRR